MTNGLVTLQQKNHTISIHFAQAVSSYFANDNREINALLAVSGINSKLLNNPRARITPRQLSQLIKAISKKLNDELLGLATPAMPLGSFSLLARNALYCHSLSEVYKNTERALRTMTSSLAMTLNVNEAHAEVHFRIQPENKNDLVILTEFVLLIWHRFPSWLADKEIPLLAVGLPFDKTAHENEYSLMFSAPITFNTEVAKLIFPRHCLAFSCQRSPEELAHYIAQLPEYWFKRNEFNESILQECLRHISASADSSMTAVAKKMNRSVRTLRRNLKTENTQFKSVKAQFLRDKAIHLITDTTTPIEDIATILGYTEASTFSRVFKQWTGSSPRDYRNTLLYTL